jgi:hypothetical protein
MLCLEQAQIYINTKSISKSSPIHLPRAKIKVYVTKITLQQSPIQHPIFSGILNYPLFLSNLRCHVMHPMFVQKKMLSTLYEDLGRIMFKISLGDTLTQ